MTHIEHRMRAGRLRQKYENPEILRMLGTQCVRAVGACRTTKKKFDPSAADQFSYLLVACS